MTFKSTERFKQKTLTGLEREKQTNDNRQTDHTSETCVAVGKIACAARAILPKTEQDCSNKLFQSVKITRRLKWFAKRAGKS